MMEAWDRRRKVSDEEAAHVLARLAHSGELVVIVNLLLDHRDMHDATLRAKLGTELLSSPEQLAQFQAAQGAVLELGKAAAALWRTGTEAVEDENRDTPRARREQKPVQRGRV